MTLYAALGAVEQGLVYGIMVIGVYLTFRILDFPDLTVDGSLPLGAAISAVAITSGVNPYLSLLLALAGGFVAGMVNEQNKTNHSSSSRYQVALGNGACLKSCAL